MMRKCSVRKIENNYSVSHGIVAKLTSGAEFSDAEDLAKQYGVPIYKQGTRYSRLPTFHTVYDFLRFFVWIKKILPICHFSMLAGLLYCIVYRYLYSTSHSMSKTGAMVILYHMIPRWHSDSQSYNKQTHEQGQSATLGDSEWEMTCH